MKTSLFRFCGVLLLAAMLAPVCVHARKKPKNPKNNMRLLYWNIQNGMWSGQGDNYDKFVEWVRAYDPDVCVWCEAQSIYKTGTADKMDVADRYLVGNWGELAARYGHKYWYVGGHRDNYPQVITSKYPIENVERLVGSKPDSVVTHGAGWARIEKNGKTVNIVTLHTWPQVYAFQAKDRDASRAENGGDKYRRMEMEYICNHTIHSVPGAEKQFWMMMGDFNSRSRADNWYYGYPENDTRLLVHNHILDHTNLKDIIAERYPGSFISSTYGNARIDYMYASPSMYARIVNALTVMDKWTTATQSPYESNFYDPSDHRPILADFELKQ